ncbi:MAG: alpha/beta hydrolase, partial [Alphaproteobacteria bacterium]|nr:alpha/beta hydrolase [Alphaproteobacteria bacterium]
GDVVALLAALGIGKVIAVGTSLGGIVSMGLAMFRPTALAGVVLNDVGPVISRDGLARIAGYVGQPVVIASLAEGAARLKAQFGTAYPDLDDAGWRRMADQIFREETAGRLVLDYDLSLGKAIAEAAAAPPADLWPLFRGLRNIPTLGIWGVLSDVLSKETFERMKSEHPAMVAAEVKSRGHVPLLEEDELVPTLDGFLDGIA